ncbi:MAG: type I-D CRISPR-associated protein Cas10d/Csc3 [Candidatus Caldarchaeum sp.]
MIHQQLLRRAVSGRPASLVDFVETIAPRLLERFAPIPALGGSGQPRPPADWQLPEGVVRFTEEEIVFFGHKNPDQSLATHVLNGLFAGLRLAERLPPEKALSDTEQRLWILGYIVHDYTKVYGIKVPPGQLDAIRQVVRHLGDDLGFDRYMPEWLDYLDDIVFLAQNTQKVEGANLNLRDYRLKTNARRLDVLRLLSSYADVLVHIKSPSEVMLPAADGRNRAENLRKTLADLFGTEHAPRLAYHKLAEVRGLLSNLINNAVMDELKRQGYEPYLFFPNGVVYLTDPTTTINITPDVIAHNVWNKVVSILASNEEFGIKRVGKDGLKIAPPLYELVDTRRILDLGISEAMRMNKSYAAERLYGFATGQSKASLQAGSIQMCEKFAQQQGWPADVRVDILAEFLIFVKRRLFGHLFGHDEEANLWLLKELKLEGVVSLEEATRSIKGGTLTGWFYVASQFIKRRQIGEPEDLRPVLQQIADNFLAYVEQQGWQPKVVPQIEQAVLDYVASVIEMNGKSAIASTYHRFENEYLNYATRKAEKKPICSICSSPYESTEQTDTVVLWLAQQYSNKNPLNTDALKRGICPVCTVEMMLRLAQQEVPSKHFADRRPIQIYLYPTYFFTLETERVAKAFLTEMRDLDIFALRRHLRSEGFSLGAFLRFDGFLGEESRPRRGIYTPSYREEEPAGLIFGSLTPLGRKPTDTDAWIIPALLSVGIPLLLDVKAVVTPSFVPLFPSGADFRETALLDGPHSFAYYVWGRDRFRVDELEEALIKLLELYDLHLDVFAEGDDPHWPQVNAVAKDVATDPLYVFSYYERKERDRRARQRKKGGGQQQIPKGISSQDLKRYLEIYYVLGGEDNMGIIGKLVDAYAAFYRADREKLDSAYAVLRPLGTAMDVIVKSDPHTERDDLLLLVVGAIHDDMERVRAGQAEGWIPLKTEEPEQKWFPLLRQKVEEFGRLCVDDLFYGYCQGDRAVLRERMNRLRSAARFYYLQNYSQK